jgi:dipeptidase D
MSKRAATILSYFEQLNAIPRCSHNEGKVCRWLQGWADERHMAHACDAGGNLVVRVPASSGYESAPIMVLQGHMDMVCEKTPQSSHNFDKDPIISHMEGDWLTAGDTTLGADNGIAIAYMLALAEDPSGAHPPLELLFTVDEETGLNGAKALKEGFIQGRILINLDSEDEGVFTIGCAGGVDTCLTHEFDLQPMAPGMRPYQVVVGGLKGGHSGIDIQKQRGNANKFLSRILTRISEVTPMGLISLHGGSRKNAIPRDAMALIGIDPAGADLAMQAVVQLEAAIKAEHAHSDGALFFTLNSAAQEGDTSKWLSKGDSDKVIHLLMALPDGVAGMSPQVEGLVETSSNLAIGDLNEGKLSIVTSQRSAVMSRLHDMTARVHAVARLAGATVRDRDAYPPWQPDMASTLLDHSKKTYRRLYGQEPIIQVIHAGLECAVIGDIYPGMEMISFGPTIRNPHSPDERLFVPSVEKVWDFLVALLKTTGPVQSTP